MKALLIGDVVGKPGREALALQIPALRDQYLPDIVIANAENAAGGVGITPDIVAELLERGGIDVITLGNHAWARREINATLDREPRVLRPANYPPGAPGRGCGVYETPAGRVAVLSLQGRIFMDPIDDPFRVADNLLADLASDVRAILIDLHAEATSEKAAFAWHVDGRCSAVVGTHTHVQTADERILPGGTAFITDVGMTGPIDSVIGMEVAGVLSRFTTMLPHRFEVAPGPSQLCAVCIEIDAWTGKCTRIDRIRVGPEVARPR